MPDRAIVVGWSLGGLLAQRIALTQPERVERLILLASSPCFVQRDDWMPALASSLFARYLSEVMTQTRVLLKSFAALQVLGAAQPKLVLKQLLPVVSALSEAHVPALYQGLRLLQVLDFRDQIHRLSMPTLWLWGTDDAIVPSVIADAIRQLQPTACQQQVVAGHLLFLSAGAGVAAAMRDFIEGGNR